MTGPGGLQQHTKRTRILFVSSMLLFRETRFGGSKRLYYLAKELEKCGDLRILCVDVSGEKSSFRQAPKDFRRILALDSDFDKGFPGRHFGFSADISRELTRQSDLLDDFLGYEDFDITLLAYPAALSILDTRWTAKCGKIVYLEDDLALETYRRGYIAGMDPARRAWKFWRHRQLLRYYRGKMTHVSAIIAISEEEREILSGYFPGKRVEVVKHGLPPGEYPLLPPPDYKAVLGFLGNYRHPPNLVALERLLEDWFPFFRTSIPGIRLHVGGLNIPDKIRSRYASDGSIAFYEDIGNLQDFFGPVGVFVNPIVSGRGMRTKLVEAAAYGRPILTTPLGAEGLPEFQMGIAGGKEDALAALRALLEAETYAAIVLGNRRAFESTFTVEAVGGRLQQVLEWALAG